MDATASVPLASFRSSPPSFDALYEQTADLAFRLLSRMGVPGPELDDALQDVFTVAHRRLSEFRGDSKASTWVSGIAIRVAHDYRRRNERKPTEALDPHAPWLQDEQPGPEDVAAKAQAADVVGVLLAKLEPTQREVFVLAELEQHAAADIAAAVGVPVNTVYSRLRLARAHFNELVEAFHGGVR